MAAPQPSACSGALSAADVQVSDEATAHFLMHGYKVIPCSKRCRHDWSVCPFAHQGEMATRRDPRDYEPLFCFYSKRRLPCPRGAACPHAHSLYEYWLHPERFRTQLCQFGAACHRPVCFFAHGRGQLRVTSLQASATPVVGAPEPMPLNPSTYALGPPVASSSAMINAVAAASFAVASAPSNIQYAGAAGKAPLLLALLQQAQPQCVCCSDGVLPVVNAPATSHVAWGGNTSLPLPASIAAQAPAVAAAAAQMLLRQQQSAQAARNGSASSSPTVELVFDDNALHAHTAPLGSVDADATSAAGSGGAPRSPTLLDLLSRQLGTVALSAPSLPVMSAPPQMRNPAAAVAVARTPPRSPVTAPPASCMPVATPLSVAPPLLVLGSEPMFASDLNQPLPVSSGNCTWPASDASNVSAEFLSAPVNGGAGNATAYTPVKDPMGAEMPLKLLASLPRNAMAQLLEMVSAAQQQRC